MIPVTLFGVLLLQCLYWSMANVIGIDFASDSLKIALVKPGRPLEIVTNFQSKRKTPSCIAFYKGERLFGSDAVALMGRKPELTFEKMTRVIGRDLNSPFVNELTDEQFHPYEFHMNHTSNMLSIKVEDGYYTSEELVAMILQNVKDITKSFAGQEVKDCVLTVPSFFTQHEKEALFAAANIAELNVLSLIEENTAAALNYGMDRIPETPTKVLFYNLGAGSVQVSIVSYSSHNAKDGGKNKTIGQFEVIGKAWDASLGGYNFDIRIAEYLATKFNQLWQKKPSGKDKDIRNFVRPMTRLRIEANKIKEILSANQDFPYRIEQLHADIDLSGKITRNEFENEICPDLFARLLVPVEQALLSANLSINEIHAVELLGGSVRIPRVKKVLDDYFKVANNVDVGQHLNGDEAMALGAAFRAANISTQFRVRKVGMTDETPFDITIRVQTLPSTPQAEEEGLLSGLFSKREENVEPNTILDTWERRTVLFPAKSSFPTKNKLIAFNYDKDILCKIEYDNKESLPAGTDPLLTAYNITGIVDFAKKHEETGVSPKVQLGFNIDSSGVARLVKAEAIIEISSTEVEEGTNNTTDAVDANNPASPANDTTGSDNAKSAQKKKSGTVIRQTLSVSEEFSAVRPPRWTPASIAASKHHLRALQAADDLRKAKAAALNELESYIYKVKNRIIDQEGSLKSISTDEQRQEVVDLANNAEDWLYNEGRDQAVSVYKSKQEEIQIKADAIFDRHTELKARPEAIKNVKSALDDVSKAVNSWSEKLPHITDEEKADLLKLVEKVDSWIEEKAEMQDKNSPFEKPVFQSREVIAQIKPVKALYEKLLKKPKPVLPVVLEKENSTSFEGSTKSSEQNATSSHHDQAHSSGHEEEVIRVEVDPQFEVESEAPIGGNIGDRETEEIKSNEKDNEEKTEDEL